MKKIKLQRLPAAMRRSVHNYYKHYTISDILYDLRHTEVTTIFDVGANIGQSLPRILRSFPEADIYAFEPEIQCYQRLLATVQNQPRVNAFNMAISSSVGALGVEVETEDLSMNRVGVPSDSSQCVKATTVDQFCTEHEIREIGFMKVDTEGHDLHVIEGAAEMLRQDRICVVEVECGMNPENKFHVPFECLKTLLESHDYRLFRIYEQVSEWPAHQPQLRRVNATYISPKTIKENTRKT